MMQNVAKRLAMWALSTAFILMVPLILTLLGSGVDGEGWYWTLSDFLIMGAAMFGVALAYELIARRSDKTVYQVAFAVGLVTAFLLFWVNGAVGIIGSENQPANLLYGAAFAVGLIGSLVSRFRPRGMAYTLFAAAFVQMSVPMIALIIWPQISWGGAGILGVFGLNAFFAMLFVLSALLFQRAAHARGSADGR